MTYKLLKLNSEGEQIYGKVDADGLVRINCCASNPDLQEWLAEGNEPLPAE